jgi:hypothetical protein
VGVNIIVAFLMIIAKIEFIEIIVPVVVVTPSQMPSLLCDCNSSCATNAPNLKLQLNANCSNHRMS